MIKKNTYIKDLFIVEPKLNSDERGWFSETYNKSRFLELGLNIEFIQDNHSSSRKKGTLRGLHLQTDPNAQTKLVRCTKGSILDVAIDLRKSSGTYLKVFTIVLSEDNKKQLLIPKGFAHGFITLEENVEVQYKVDQYYSKENDRSIRYNDPLFNIDWGTDEIILSEKDKNAPLYYDSDVDFK